MGFAVRDWCCGCGLAAAMVVSSSCRPHEKPLVSKSQTFAELRAIKRGVKVTPPGEARREPYARERLVDGEVVELEAGGLAWLRRDGGSTVLVKGPAKLTLRADSIEVAHGKAFVDTPRGAAVELSTPRGSLHLSAVRASLEVEPGGASSVYVLRGAARTDASIEAGPGELLSLAADGKATRTPVKTWEDWTGGLATTDRAAEPAPFGLGTVGARKPGELGEPRFPLAIQRLDVRVTVVDDFATTEVDEVFANPSADTVEGIYGFRTPEGATLARFGVDRDGQLVFGRVKEKQAAAAQYQANVYEGSTEDPALLEWDSPGTYKARLYPIKPRETRRVVTRYGEWLGRQGPRGERRLYVYPMAAEGTEGTLPRIEELTFTLDLERAHARDVRVGMSGKQVASKVIVKAYDVVPRADLSVELYDDGPARLTAYRAAHSVDRETVAADELARAEKTARGEASYLLVPVRPSRANEPPGGLDLAIVIDTSAATEPASLGIARGAAGALLAHLGPDDRAAVWAGDASLRAVAEGSDKFGPVDEARRRAIATGLARIDRGGATDLGAILAEAASRLDVTRRGAVVYIGDGQPTVGELSVPDLRERLGRLPRPVRVFGLGVGDQANLGILSGISHGGFAVRVGDAHAAAETALQVLERAERPSWLGATADLGPGVDRVYPRELGALVADESAIVVGRVVGAVPARLTVHGAGGDVSEPLLVRPLDDGGDLRRRWAEARLVQLLDEGAGRAAVVEVGVRSGVITPFTSLYVPTAAEHATEMGRASEAIAEDGSKETWWHWLTRGGGGPGFGMSRQEAAKYVEVAEKEGGTGTRAKGEEGSMGKAVPATAEPAAPPAAEPATKTAARPVEQPTPMAGRRLDGAKKAEVEKDGPSNDGDDRANAAHAERQKQLREATEFGMIGLADKADSAPAASATNGAPPADALGDAFGGGGLGLSGIGEGGGGGPRGGGIGLGAIGDVKSTASASAGSGRGVANKISGVHSTSTPLVRAGAVAVNGRLPPEVIQRIVRQNFGRFRLCYEQGLAANPLLAGKVSVSFVIGSDGSVPSATDAGSTLADARVVDCIARSFRVLSFPAPEGGNVTVVYPMSFAPGAGFEGTDPTASMKLGQVGHTVVACSRSADLPLPERKSLWRERIAGVSGNVDNIAAIYWRALGGCEAPSWRERAALLVLGVDSLPTIPQRVALWRKFWKSPAAADVIYRAILTRVHTAADLRVLHDALGMRHLDRSLLAKALAERHTEQERLDLLRGLVAKWPDDLELALTLLDALEDARNTGEGRALARRLRRRSDATTRVRTSVGEYYLRIAATETGATAGLDTTEARRTFGEIVELSPDDPGARRLLGDLLRAHGWYEEALRQYETLKRLAPDDPEVSLLLALAAEGLGRTEEAIRWTEKAAGAGAPDPTSALAKTSRAFASAFLAWARLGSPTTDDAKDQAARLRERARRLMVADVPDGKSVRFILTWSHPELHPELWSNGLGAPMPAADGDAGLGLAQALVPTTQADGFVEVRLAPEDAERAARLGASAVLTAITSEGEDGERIEKLPVAFAKVDGHPPEKRRFRVDGGALREVSL